MLRRGCVCWATPADIDDAIQEAFIRAFAPASRHAYDGLRPFCDYLLGIARHVLADRRRAGYRRARLLGEHVAPLRPSVRTPDDEVSDSRLRKLYRDFSASLSPRDRVLLDLRFVGNASRREVSERTGYSAMRVRIRERAIRRALFELLKTAGYGPDGARNRRS